jgi:hypothetical protein
LLRIFKTSVMPRPETSAASAADGLGMQHKKI